MTSTNISVHLLTSLLASIGGQACFYNPSGSAISTDPGASEATSISTTGSTADATGTTLSSATIPTSGTAEASSTIDDPLPDPPAATTLYLSFSQVKHFDFSWGATAEATYYQLLERLPGAADDAQLGGDITGESVSLRMPLHLRLGASYRLRACNAGGCTESAPVDVVDSMATAIGYFKASNTDVSDNFGVSIAISADGDTLAVGAEREDSAAPGIDGDQTDDSLDAAGAVYVFARVNDVWTQQAYIKASNPSIQDLFGEHLALSGDGDTLAVGAAGENNTAKGINGDQHEGTDNDTGAVYVYARSQGAWTQQAYVKASNTGEGDRFGTSVALSADGDRLVVGAPGEGSAAAGVDGDQADNSLGSGGAAYVFVRDVTWTQQAYIKASNPTGGSAFGSSITLSADGNTLAVAAVGESSLSTGIDSVPVEDAAINAGAAYVFAYVDDVWAQQAYIKASNTGESDYFANSLSLSGNGDILAVGAYGDDSNATGIDGNDADGSADTSGAVFVFARAESKWSQQAYIKASNAGAGELFGFSVALAADGTTLAVGAIGESGAATGVGGEQGDDSADYAGAVYVFTQANGIWSQRAYVKAPNTDQEDRFGTCVALSADGNTLAVAAEEEESAAVGVNGNDADNSTESAGAAYLL